MSTKESKGGRGVKVVVAILVLAVGGYFTKAAVFPSAERALASGKSKLVVDALSRIDQEAFAAEGNSELRGKAIATLKDAPLEDVFDLLRSDKLTEEERARLQGNLQELMRESMSRNVNEFYDAPEEEKIAVMDRHIDEMVAFQEKMRAYWEKHKDDPEFKNEGDGAHRTWRQPSKEARKRHMEGTNPDSMIRMGGYWMKMQQRATERGVKMWGHGGGRSGEKKD
jgi:hypothetical protein